MESERKLQRYPVANGTQSTHERARRTRRSHKIIEQRRFLMQNDANVNVLDELVKLAKMQRERVLAMLAREEKSGFINPRLESEMRMLEHLLLSIQKMRFDLGLDERKRDISWKEAAERHAEEQRTIYDTYMEAERILEKRLGPVGARVPGFDTEAN
jgi:hypothetical protein